MPDSMGYSYFGAGPAVFDRVGKAEVQAQLYMSMVGQALFYSSMLAEFRSTNIAAEAASHTNRNVHGHGHWLLTMYSTRFVLRREWCTHCTAKYDCCRRFSEPF